MPISLQEFVRDLQVNSAILFFGAGSSIPSNVPSVQDIIDHLSIKFNQPKHGFILSEFTELIERKSSDRRRMISELRHLFKGVRPTAGLLNLPLYDWKSIYTTNYDDLIEQSYQKSGNHFPL